MQLLLRVFWSILFLSCSVFAFAQTDDPAANYKTALSLVSTNKGTEAIPYLEKVTKTSSAYTAAAYSLLGSVYDNNHQPEKAIVAYKDGIKAYPQDQSLYYNLGLAYFRDKHYGEAEIAAIKAIKLDPKNANSQRMYALVTFHQNKRMNALLGFCSFLLLEPNTPRSAEAVTNMQSILKGGMLKEDGKGTLSAADIKERTALNAAIATVTASAQAKKLSGANLLEYELKGIFTNAGQFAEKKANKTFFDKFYAAYFYKLAQSNNMSAFANLVANKEMDAGLMEWAKGAERGL